MQMVILAGGPASRMRPLSEVTPGPLVAVEDRPFLAYQLDLLRANGIRRIVLCVGHLAHKVRAYFRDGASFGVEIQYSEDGPRLLGTAGALRKARRLLDDTFFVMYGDTYVVVQYPRIWSYFNRFDQLGLLVLNAARGKRGRGSLEPSAGAQSRRLAGRRSATPFSCAVRDGLVVRYRPQAASRIAGASSAEEPDRSDPVRKIPAVFSDAGLSILRKAALSLVPPRRRLDLPTLFDRLARQGQLLALRTESGAHSIASPAGLSEFRRYIAAMSA